MMYNYIHQYIDFLKMIKEEMRMKQMLKTGKKALSVIMAVMMVLTAWVWVAPTEASAINAGKYYFEVSINVTNDADGWNHSRVYLHHKGSNGQNSTADKETLSTVSDEFGENSTITYTGTVDGFPCGYTHEYSFGGGVTWRKLEYTITIKVGASASSTLHEIFSTSYTASSSAFSAASGTFGTTSNITATKPKATTVVWDKEPTDFTILSSTYGRTHCLDQYGVVIGANPTNTFTSTPTTGLSGSTTNGTSYSQYTITASNSARMSGQGTNSRSVSMTASYTFGGATASDSKSFIINDPSYNVVLNANGTDAGLTTTSPISRQYGDKYNVAPGATRTGFTLLGFYYNDHDDSYETVIPNSTQLTTDTAVTETHTWYAAWQANQYSMSFKYRDNDGQWVTSDPVTEYYGRNIPFPTVTSPVNDGVDYTYTFTGWSPAQTTVQDVDGQVYTAVYDEEVHYADKTNLNKAIAVAEAKLEEQKYIDGGYTEESVKNFEDALHDAYDALGILYYLSQQDALDLVTNNLIAATNNLTTKKYIVMFVDEDGTILKEGYHFVEYGESVDVPADPTQSPDADYHYEFVEWNSNLSDGLGACNYVTDDLRYIATFNAIPHSYTETTTPSTCTADGVITYTCVCGYSYTAVNSADLAHHTWSTDYKELVPATCATKGSEAKYCTACGAIDESTRREITELGHAFGAYTEYTPATCFGKGAEIAECSRCQALDVIEIPQLSHQYGNAEKVEMTCIADGYTKETCSICGFVNIRDIEKTKGHTLKVETVPETCVSIGYAKTYCEKCDFERTTVYPATGWHTYPDTWETVAEATCVGHGIEKRVCTVCNSATETRLTDLADHTAPADWTTEAEAWCGVEGRRVKDCTVCGKELDSEAIPALEHNYEAYPNASYHATCTSAGADAEKCSRCGDINTTVIQPSGHKYENEGAKVTTEADCTHSAFITYDCDNCDYTYTEYVIGSTVKAHTWVETDKKAADCENDGYIRYKCSVCNATKETILSKTGHSYGAWEVVKEATNDEDGQWKRVCTNNPDHIEYVTIPKGGHTFAEDAAQYIAPKCNKKGQRVYKCTAHTDCIAAVTVVLDEVQHTVKQKETAATCTKTGSVEAYCTVCGKVFSTEEIPVKAHNFVAQDAVAPTCTTSGYTPYKCSDCGFTYNVYDETKPATGHSLVEDASTATCTAEGTMALTCENCTYSTSVEVPALGHNYVEDTAAATTADCDTPATKTYKCSRENCDASYVEYVSAANGHKWSESWTVVREATDDKHGVEKTTCTVCGEEKFRTTEPIGDHNFNVVTVNATCTQPGSKTYTCSEHTDCSANYKEEIPATGHTGELDYTAPTCTTAGSTQIICVVCSAEISDKQIIPAAGHTYDRGVVTLEAGCATTGTKTYTCSCGDSYTETIHAKGHKLTTVVNDAICDKAGSVVITCANCNDPAVEKTVELAAKGHIWNTAPESTSAADCENDGSKTYKCQFCDEKNVVVIPKLGHDWGEWKVTKASTNTEKGVLTRTCSKGCTETAEIPAGGHELVIDAAKSIDASCSAEGTLVYKCNNHADCGITVSVSVPKTQHTVAQRERLATCTTTGTVEAYCSVCNVVLSTEEIPVKAHDFVAQTPVASTCTTSGYTPYTCSCGASYNKYNADENATGHNYVKVENSSTATCTAEGTITLKCSVCNNEINVEVPALGHDYAEDEVAATEATCAAAATKTYKCLRCTASYTISEGDKLTGDNVHSWGAWTVKESATATSIGYKTRVCNVCDKLEVETIPATGEHVLEATTSKPATCTEKGWIDYKCSAHPGCGVTDRVELPATGHTETLEYTPATCDETGSTKMVCSVCGDTIKEEEIPALGHLYGEGTVTNATCKDTGKIKYTCTRENCGATHETVIATNANAHQYATVVTDSTCTVAGSVVTKCSLCGKITTDKKLPKLEHSWNGGETTDATCTADGKTVYTCTANDCGATKTETIEATGHSWSSWVKTDATNTADGEWKRTCSECGESERLAIPRGHSLVHNTDESSDASCTAEGKVVYSCESHTDCGVKIELTLDKLQHELETNYDKKEPVKKPARL